MASEISDEVHIWHYMIFEFDIVVVTPRLLPKTFAMVIQMH